MRRVLPLLLLLALPGLVSAQPVPPAKIESVRVGFRNYRQDRDTGSFKVGLMAPVYVEITAGPDGLGPRKEGAPPPSITIHTVDSEDVGTIYTIPQPVVLPPNQTQTYLGYVKVGTMGSEVRVKLHDAAPRPIEATGERTPINVNNHLYVTLGARLPDLPAALASLAAQDEKGRNKNQNFRPSERTRTVGFESDPNKLPDHWYGYQGVDLVILCTSDPRFLNQLAAPIQADRLRALAQWVRRGGRLVIPVAYQTQAELHNLLRSAMWQPRVPVVPPAEQGLLKDRPQRRLLGAENWGEVQNKPFPAPGAKAVPIARLNPGAVPAGAWEILAWTRDEGGEPLIARVKYGLGQITYLAFALDGPDFAKWDGRVDFLKAATVKLAPRAAAGLLGDGQGPVLGGPVNDLSTNLLNDLDNFDVRVIPFGYVALFIAVYILVVGPLDFFILKYVFQRLEWTWITFPTVVLGVSLIAYFAAYALKGNDLKINKVDLIDFDLRTGADVRPVRQTQAVGNSFFTILSPRIQNYTVGIEPNAAFWGGAAPAKPLSADLVTWMGRPDNAPWGMSRGGTQSFFSGAYSYRDEAAALQGVPIPVWTTKAFLATWQATVEKPPLRAKLQYHLAEHKGKNLKVSGTLQNDLPLILDDVWLLYDQKCYPITGGLPAAQDGQAARTIELEGRHAVDFKTWVNYIAAGGKSPGRYDPTPLIKQILFHEQLGAGNVGNHLLRSLDQGWRFREALPRGNDSSTREAILFARIMHDQTERDAETQQESAVQPLATKLWLGDYPTSGSGRPRPPLPGYLHQDTYIRVLLPLRPVAQP